MGKMANENLFKETVIDQLIKSSKQKVKNINNYKECNIGIGIELESSEIVDEDKESFINEIKNEVYEILSETLNEDRQTLENVFNYDILFKRIA